MASNKYPKRPGKKKAASKSKKSPKGGRAREVLSRGPQKNVEVLNYPHLKDDEIHAEGQLAPKAVTLIAFFPQVTRLQEEPEKIPLGQSPDDGHAYPDLRLTINQGDRPFVEVKPFVFADQPEVRSHLVRVKDAIRKRYSERYIVLTDLAIELEPRWTNVSLLMHYRYVPIPDELLSRTRTLFDQVDEISIAAFVEQVCDGQLAVCYGMVACGLLRIDVHQPITPATILRASFADTQKINITELFGEEHELWDGHS
jgi:hypothetical protein